MHEREREGLDAVVAFSVQPQLLRRELQALVPRTDHIGAARQRPARAILDECKALFLLPLASRLRLIAFTAAIE